MEKQHQLTIDRPLQDSPRFGNKYFIIQSGNSRDTPQGILKHLHKRIPGLKEVYTVDECDVILVFCPIVSRAGTDMEAALNGLNRCSASKPALFMVLHHTHEREKIVPDSSRFVSRENTLTVNFLFNEDTGLLECAMNEKALIQIIEHFEPQTLWQQVKIVFWFIISAVVCLTVRTVQILWQQVKIFLLFIISPLANIVRRIGRTVQILWQQVKMFLLFIISPLANLNRGTGRTVQTLWQQVKIVFWFIISTVANIVRGTSKEQHRRV